MSLAGVLLTMALALTAVVAALLRRRCRWGRKKEPSPVLIGVAIILAVIALLIYFAAIIVIKSISVE